MSRTDADHAAADAVVAHHAQLAGDLNRRVASLRAAAEPGRGPQWAEIRQDLLTWLRAELLPCDCGAAGGRADAPVLTVDSRRDVPHASFIGGLPPREG
jgi:hypothetical protein